MENYHPMDSFNETAAADYEHLRGDEAHTVDFLAGLAGGGPVLELAIGSGRVALPLAARGLRVDGVELSPHMVEQLRTKPGGAELDVVIGDMAEVPVGDGRRYSLIYLVYNTLFNLLTQSEQVSCFQNAAAHLSNDGVFVVETFVPGYLHRLRDDQYVDAEHIGVGHVKLDVGRHDPVAQTLDESHVVMSSEGIKVFPIVCRYAWPSELDLMARLAGMRLRERWGGWQREAFTGQSRNCVSVYGR